jgi:hypothetical protein
LNKAQVELLWLDVCRPDYLAPFFGLLGDEFTELGWNGARTIGATGAMSRMTLKFSFS